LEGLLVKKNQQGHKVIRLHYTADPDKNPLTQIGQEWFEKEVSKYIGGTGSLGWRREMEIDFGAGSGELVFPEFFDMQDTLTCPPFEIDDTYNLFGGFDWGTRNPLSFHVYAESLSHRFFSIWEYFDEHKPVPYVARRIRECPYYERLQWIAADPSIWTENISKRDGFTSVASMMQDEEEVGEEFVIDKLAPAHDRSDVSAINKFKSLWSIAPPKFVFFRNCVNQINEFKNLKYPERRETMNETEKILDKDNHCYSADTYILTKAGWKKFTELQKVDAVAVWGTEGILAYEVPKEILSYDYDGEMCELENDWVSFSVTPNHKMWVADQASAAIGKPEFKRVSVGDLPPVSWISRSVMGHGREKYPSVLCQLTKDKIKRVPYKGKVYCVNTDSGVVYVKRHGKGMWCGQSWDDAKYFILSHPYAKSMEEKPKFGSIKYINEISNLAADLAANSGRSIQEEFNELYGQQL
jgi:hypothetical protein